MPFDNPWHLNNAPASGFDLLASASRKFVRMHHQRLRHIAVAEDFERLILSPNNTRLQKRFWCHFDAIRPRVETLDVDHLIFNPKDIRKAALEGHTLD
jgi:hypothetical protein